MTQTSPSTRMVEIAQFGERLAPLRLCDDSALEKVKCSLERHGQLNGVIVFGEPSAPQILDGFKRLRAARALGWSTLLAHFVTSGIIDAKLRLLELHGHHGLTEIEEAWLVRSLYREDGLSQPEIARLMGRHKSWVCRRLVLVEAIDVSVQANVRLGLLAPRAAVALSRLPRGTQEAACRVVVRYGLTVQQTDRLVGELLEGEDAAAHAELLARRIQAPSPADIKPKRPASSEAVTITADVTRLRDLAARLEARLLKTPLQTLPHGAAQVLRDALLALCPVLRALTGAISAATQEEVLA